MSLDVITESTTNRKNRDGFIFRSFAEVLRNLYSFLFNLTVTLHSLSFKYIDTPFLNYVAFMKQIYFFSYYDNDNIIICQTNVKEIYALLV